MRATRRRLIAAASLLAAARAAAAAEGLVLTCDLAAAPAAAAAIRAFRAQTGIRVRMVPVPPDLIVPQLRRESQAGIVLTQPRWLDQAGRQGLLAPGGHAPAWRNPVVIATGGHGPADSFALPDPTPASDFKGPEILMRLRLTPQVIYSVIDTAAVAALLLDATARQGLLHQTEMAARPALTLVRQVPDSVTPPILYAATATARPARQADPQALVGFLATPACRTILHAAGLEPLA